MLGDGVLEAVEIENTRTGERHTLSTPAVFSFIGAVPRTDWLPAAIETDDKGFVRTGRAVKDSAHWTLDREPFMLEINTVPGQSEASLVPQQVKAMGWTLKEFYTAVIEEAFA